MPARTRCLVLDEVHWLADPDRGAAWTAALLGTECDELHLVGSEDALPLLRAMSPRIEVAHYERFCPLEYTGETDVTAVGPGTIAVVFGEKAVYALARTLSARFPGRVGVLYGAMPLVDRRDQIDAFAAGRTEVLVATDVLGHGVNLPAETVLFAETSKFDGVERRDLAPWEVAQIAGRAGRYGFRERGAVGILAGVGWGGPSEAVVLAGLTPTVPVGDGRLGFRALSAAVLGPVRRDLGPVATRHWGEALAAWADAAAGFAAGRPWLAVADLSAVRGLLATVGPDVAARLAPADLWSLIHAPADALDRPEAIISDMASVLAGGSLSLGKYLVTPGRDSTLEALERYNDTLTMLRWFATRWPGRGGIDAPGVARVEAACHRLFARASAAEIERNAYGLCEDCGTACAPWFRKCEPCFAAGRLYRRAGWASFGGGRDDEGFG